MKTVLSLVVGGLITASVIGLASTANITSAAEKVQNPPAATQHTMQHNDMDKMDPKHCADMMKDPEIQKHMKEMLAKNPEMKKMLQDLLDSDDNDVNN